MGGLEPGRRGGGGGGGVFKGAPKKGIQGIRHGTYLDKILKGINRRKKLPSKYRAMSRWAENVEDFIRAELRSDRKRRCQDGDIY